MLQFLKVSFTKVFKILNAYGAGVMGCFKLNQPCIGRR